MSRTASFRSHDDDVRTTINPSGDLGTQKCPPAAIPSEDPPFTHGFLDRDQESAKARAVYFKIIGGSLALVFIYVIWGVLPIYWASVFELYKHAHNLHGWVVVSI